MKPGRGAEFRAANTRESIWSKEKNQLPANPPERIAALLESLYGTRIGSRLAGHVGQLLNEFGPRLHRTAVQRGALALTQRDAWIIAYIKE